MTTQTHLTTGQAARTLGLSAERIRQLVREDRLPCVETPLGRLYPRAEVDALAARRRLGERLAS